MFGQGQMPRPTMRPQRISGTGGNQDPRFSAPNRNAPMLPKPNQAPMQPPPQRQPMPMGPPMRANLDNARPPIVATGGMQTPPFVPPQMQTPEGRGPMETPPVIYGQPLSMETPGIIPDGPVLYGDEQKRRF